MSQIDTSKLLKLSHRENECKALAAAGAIPGTAAGGAGGAAAAASPSRAPRPTTRDARANPAVL